MTDKQLRDRIAEHIEYILDNEMKYDREYKVERIDEKHRTDNGYSYEVSVTGTTLLGYIGMTFMKRLVELLDEYDCLYVIKTVDRKPAINIY